MPAREVTVTASLTSGFGIEPRAFDTTRKPGREAMTAPKPYSDAVLVAASMAPAIALLEPSAKFLNTGFQAKMNTVRMPRISAPSTAQIAASLAVSCTTGGSLPMTAGSNEVCGPYQRGIHTLSTLFITPTTTSGRIAIRPCGSFSPST